MAQKIKIGIVFSNNNAWIGGTYYILNLIQALKTLSNEKKPYLVVFYEKREDIESILNIEYPYISFLPLYIKYNIFQRFINKITHLLFSINIITKTYSKDIVDIVFPFDFQESLKGDIYKLAWIPDLQEHFLDHFFSHKELENRKEHQQKIIKAHLPIVFSSKVVQNHFHTIYPDAKNQTFVLNFAVSHPNYSYLSENFLLKKYSISKKYFIAPNQFWVHKNHQTILKAIKYIKETNKKIPFQIVFTGKEYDFRHPEYTKELKDFVRSHNLQEDILFLGFIDRVEQLKLMEQAVAVIQPSLFEGWSTVVEDAKAMNKALILSDIEVHREQVTNSMGIFFSPQDASSLSKHIEDFFNKKKTFTFTNNYHEYVESFGLKFIKIINLVLKNANTLY